jgi:hypothetical protein
MAGLVPKDKQSLAKYREVVGGAVDVMIGRGLPAKDDVKDRPVEENAIWLQDTRAGEEVHAMIFKPSEWNKKRIAIWVSKKGGLADTLPTMADVVEPLGNKGTALMAIDLFGQSDSADGKPMKKNRLNRSGQGPWATYAGYTYGYNHSLFAQRVHDILTAVTYARHTLGAEQVYVVGLGGAGHWVAAARAQAGAAIDRAVVDTAGFRFANLKTIDDADFLPGGAKYLDLPGILALSAPYPLWLAGEGEKAPPVVDAAYRAAGEPDRLTVFSGDRKEALAAAIKWLQK